MFSNIPDTTLNACCTLEQFLIDPPFPVSLLNKDLRVSFQAKKNADIHSLRVLENFTSFSATSEDYYNIKFRGK